MKNSVKLFGAKHGLEKENQNSINQKFSKICNYVSCKKILPKTNVKLICQYKKLWEEEMAVKIDEGTCVGCAACIDVCPVEALEMVNNKAVCNEDKCVDCGACLDACPVAAITL